MSEPATTPANPHPPGKLGKSARDILWFAALAVVVVVLLHESLFTGKGLVPSDGILNWPPWNQSARPSNGLLSDQFFVFLPTQEFVHQQKHFPLWNPYLCCGMPNLGSIQSALLFPIRLLFSPLDPFSASGPSALLKLCLTGWFTILYLRLLGVSNAGAFLAGLAFSLCGFMIVWLGHPLVNSAMWLPLLLYFVEKSFREGRENAVSAKALRAWAAFAIAFAFMILGGHPPTAIHVSIVVAAYFGFRLMDHGRKQAWLRAGLLAGSVVVGLLLAAPQILPYLEYYHQSSSAMSSASLDRWSSRLTFPTLIHFLLPNALGNPAFGFTDLPKLLGWPEVDNFNAMTGYVGVLPLFFAACAITLRRCKYTLFFLCLAIGSMLVIYAVPPVPALVRLLPVLRDVNHTRLLLIVAFSMAALAGLGWDELNRLRTPRRALIVAGGFFAVVIVALLLSWHVAAPNLGALDAARRAFLQRQFLILAIGLGAILLLAAWPAHWKGWIPMVVGLGWAAGDLLCFGTGYNPAIPRDQYYPPTQAIQWLQKDNSLFRIFGGLALPPDGAEVFGLNDARGTDFMGVRRYEELITGRAGDFFFYRYPAAIPTVMPLLNVKYCLSTTGISPDPAHYELSYSNEISIFRYKECRDRALLVFDSSVEKDQAAVLARVSSAGFDPRKTLLLEDQPLPVKKTAAALAAGTNSDGFVRILSYEPDDITIDASPARPGFLLLLDTWFPGWTATVNGEPAPILRADYNFRAVQLPAGQSTVRFSYRPKSLTAGLCLCAAGVVALAAAWFLPRGTS